MNGPNRVPSPALSSSTIQSQGTVPPSSQSDSVPEDPIRAIRVEVSRKLSWWDVSALIINKMIGTGIFTGPPVVLLYTGNKTTAIGLWAAGFVYTLVSMTLYLEYARQLPFTGGELVYLDEVMPDPPLLAYTVYALYFILIYTTTTNSMQFARQVIIASTHQNQVTDQRVLRLIAVVIISTICLLLYFSTSTGRRLNRYTAYAKVAMMLVIIIAGAVKASPHPAKDLGNSFFKERSHASSAAALLQVLYAFQGWENATLVAAEIPNNKTLRKGFISAVWIVGLLYLAINVAYCYAIPWNSDGTLNVQFVPLFFGNTTRAQVTWAVLIAVSAVGSMVSVTYTCVRVKQTIGWLNIIPWSKLWRTSAPLRSNHPATETEMQLLFQGSALPANSIRTIRLGAPQGGLALHWTSCVFFICVTAAIKNVNEAISFSGLLLSYGHAIVGVFVGLMFPRFAGRRYQAPEVRGWLPGETPRWLAFKPLQWVLGGGYAMSSIAILVLSVLPPYVNADNTPREVKGWVFAVIMFGILASSILYYMVFLAGTHTTGVHLAGVNLERKVHGVNDRGIRGVHRKCDVCDEYDGAHRHSRDGYQNYFELHFPSGVESWNFLYKFFGGPKRDHHPDLRLDDAAQELRDGIKAIARVRQKVMNPAAE